MIRPEAAAALVRWRGALIGAGVLALGLWWGVFTGGGLLQWVGYAVILIGVALIFSGVQKARFRTGQDSPGIVRVVEGRIEYFGPLSGGIVALDDLERLTLDPTASPQQWLLHRPGEPPIAIPLGAAGADALFDAFVTLPGLRTEHMLRQMREARGPVTIWQHPAVQERTPRLH